jgi:hypothetical protein
MRPIAEATTRITGKSFSRKYIALGRIVNSWNEIVGPDLATKAQPAKIRYSKRPDNGTPAAVLDIATTTADATLLHYQKDLILERINRIFGEGWVTGIRFVSMAGNDTRFKVRKTKKPLTEQEKTYLSHILEGVEDLDVKARLGSLGESILTEPKT